MKKLMIALAALSLVSATQAASYHTEVFFNLYEGKSCDVSYYSVYTLSQSEAQAAMGTKDKVTYQTYADWLGKSFADNKDATTSAGSYVGVTTFADGDEVYIYAHSNAGYAVDSLYDAIVVGFYDNGTDLAYNVMANRSYADDDALYYGDEFFAKESMESSTGWIPVETPEPTSGLLMLVGLAGLALKRKRA